MNGEEARKGRAFQLLAGIFDAVPLWWREALHSRAGETGRKAGAGKETRGGMWGDAVRPGGYDLEKVGDTRRFVIDRFFRVVKGPTSHLIPFTPRVPPLEVCSVQVSDI